jgi:hypothetical protein
MPAVETTTNKGYLLHDGALKWNSLAGQNTWQRRHHLGAANTTRTIHGLRHLGRTDLPLLNLSFPAHDLHQLPPALNPPPGMLTWARRRGVGHGSREQLQGNPSLEAQSLGEGFQHVDDRQIARLLKGEQPCVSTPRHAAWLSVDVEYVVLGQGIPQALGVDNLDEEDFADVDSGPQPLHAEAQVFVGIGDLPIRTGRVRPGTPGDVERVETDPEIRPVNRGNQIPRPLPRIDVLAPAQILVRKPDDRRLLQPHLGHLGQIPDQNVPIPRRALGLEIGRDLDEIGAQLMRQPEPDLQLLDTLGVLLRIRQALVVHERLQVDNLQPAIRAHLLDVARGLDAILRRQSARKRLRKVFEVLVEDLDALVLVLCSLIQLVGELVDPGAAQGHGGDAYLVGGHFDGIFARFVRRGRQ